MKNAEDQIPADLKSEGISVALSTMRDDRLRQEASQAREAARVGFRRDLESLINKHSQENGSGTPDFILAQYLTECLSAFDLAVGRRDSWYGKQPPPGENAGFGLYGEGKWKCPSLNP